MKEKVKRKKFLPEFKPQYIRVYIYQNGCLKNVYITNISYTSEEIEIIGRISRE